MISRTDAPAPEIFRPQCLLLCDISRIREQRFGIAFGGEAATLPVKSGPDLSSDPAGKRYARSSPAIGGDRTDRHARFFASDQGVFGRVAEYIGLFAMKLPEERMAMISGTEGGDAPLSERRDV
ncbi:hypothetical protein M3484_16965 [Pseudomonas sp. GX19020]|uniref:hypothetical protein n=1 Tax=Pseudomonas sp. GX19020 TaxID=2942277 RepID=UPI00201A1784|nr:hypothetical protein [Pseudomonas sp. GX19020]MCL4068259.1 hypothetical protein [Pseudomonas sp. GX19020]